MSHYFNAGKVEDQVMSVSSGTQLPHLGRMQKGMDKTTTVGAYLLRRVGTKKQAEVAPGKTGCNRQDTSDDSLTYLSLHHQPVTASVTTT